MTFNAWGARAGNPSASIVRHPSLRQAMAAFYTNYDKVDHRTRVLAYSQGHGRPLFNLDFAEEPMAAAALGFRETA